MNPYTAIVDQARLIYSERADQIKALPDAAEKGDRIAKAKLEMVDHLRARLADVGRIGRVLAAVASAHDKDPAALEALIGKPLEGKNADR